MARTYDDYHKDIEALKTLKIGDRVKYVSKRGVIKTGVIAKFVEYKGRYGNWCEHREYFNYTSVTVHLDDGKSHINVSPRNLVII